MRFISHAISRPMRKFMGFPELSFYIRKGGKLNKINNLDIFLNELVSALKNFINFKVFEITILNFLGFNIYLHVAIHFTRTALITGLLLTPPAHSAASHLFLPVNLQLNYLK